MKANFEDVKSEIWHLKDEMDNWEDHCQLLLKCCFGMNFQDFLDFIQYILQRRKHSIQTNKELKVYGEWTLDAPQLEFDLLKGEELLEVFFTDEDVKRIQEKKILH